MRRTDLYREKWNTTGGTNVKRRQNDPVRTAIAQLKQAVLMEYGTFAGEHTRVLRLALNEAEALAWQTSHPHLFFPALAVEKAQATLAWHRRQLALTSNELAFAE